MASPKKSTKKGTHSWSKKKIALQKREKKTFFEEIDGFKGKNEQKKLPKIKTDFKC